MIIRIDCSYNLRLCFYGRWKCENTQLDNVLVADMLALRIHEIQLRDPIIQYWTFTGYQINSQSIEQKFTNEIASNKITFKEN